MRSYRPVRSCLVLRSVASAGDSPSYGRPVSCCRRRHSLGRYRGKRTTASAQTIVGTPWRRRLSEATRNTQPAVIEASEGLPDHHLTLVSKQKGLMNQGLSRDSCDPTWWSPIAYTDRAEERCESGRIGLTANELTSNRGPRVQIPPSPLCCRLWCPRSEGARPRVTPPLAPPRASRSAPPARR